MLIGITTIAWLLGLIFAAAAWHKFRAGPRFTASLAAYNLVPESLLASARWFLIVAEISACVLLLLVNSVGLLLAAALLLAYTFAIAINLARGRRSIDCGCGDTPVPLTSALLWRNGFLITLALCAWYWHGSMGTVASTLVANVTIEGLASALIFSFSGFFIYLTAEQLTANRGAMLAREQQ